MRTLPVFLCLWLAWLPNQALAKNAAEPANDETTSLLEPPRFPELIPIQPNFQSIPTDAVIVPLRLSEPSPFDGVLWNNKASAWLITEFEFSQYSIIIECNKRIEAMRLWGTHSIDMLLISHQAEVGFLNLRIKSQEKIILDLQEINNKQIRQVKRGKIVTVLTVIGVAVVSGLAGYGIAKIAN